MVFYIHFILMTYSDSRGRSLLLILCVCGVQEGENLQKK